MPKDKNFSLRLTAVLPSAGGSCAVCPLLCCACSLACISNHGALPDVSAQRAAAAAAAETHRCCCMAVAPAQAFTEPSAPDANSQQCMSISLNMRTLKSLPQWHAQRRQLLPQPLQFFAGWLPLLPASFPSCLHSARSAGQGLPYRYMHDSESATKASHDKVRAHHCIQAGTGAGKCCNDCIAGH
jgi:hypothetical protein